MYLKYDGIDFHIEVCYKMGREGFIKHRMHDNHWPRKTRDEKEKILNNVFELIKKLKGD